MAKRFLNSNAGARPTCAEYSAVDFTGASPYTICCWIKGTANPILDWPVCVKWGSGAQYGLFFMTSVKFSMIVRDGSNKVATTASTYNTSVWNHVAGIYDGTNVKIKVNAGVTEDVTGDAAAATDNSAENVTVGQYSTGGAADTRLGSDVAHVCIFNRALSNQELKTVMYLGPRMVSGLVLWFPLYGDVEHNLAPVSSKTSVSGGAIADYPIIEGPPMAAPFGFDIPSVALSNPALTLSLSDTLSMSDAAVVAERKTLTAADTNAANWNDVFALDYLAPATPQTINISDRIDKQKGNSINTVFPAWADAVDIVLLPGGPLQIQTNDLNTFNDDSVIIGTGHAFSDTLSLSDSASVALGILVEAFDSMFFHIGDSASVLSFANIATITATDSLNNWLDSVSVDNAGNPIPPLSDSMTMGDSAALKLNHLATFSDTLTISDTAAVALGVRLTISDDLNNWLDSGVAATLIMLGVSVGDTLSMSDATSLLPNTALTNYLRRYLNDVVN